MSTTIIVEFSISLLSNCPIFFMMAIYYAWDLCETSGQSWKACWSVRPCQPHCSYADQSTEWWSTLCWARNIHFKFLLTWLDSFFLAVATSDQRPMTMSTTFPMPTKQQNMALAWMAITWQNGWSQNIHSFSKLPRVKFLLVVTAEDAGADRSSFVSWQPHYRADWIHQRKEVCWKPILTQQHLPGRRRQHHIGSLSVWDEALSGEPAFEENLLGLWGEWLKRILLHFSSFSCSEPWLKVWISY